MVKLEAFYPQTNQWVSFRDGHVLGAPEEFILGTTKPDENGPIGLVTPATQVLTTTQTFSTNNATEVVIDNRRFENYVTISGRRYRFYDCDFDFSSAIGAINRGIVNCISDNVQEIIFERCRFHQETTGYGLYGLFGHDFTVIQCDFSGTEDGIGVAFNTSRPDEVNVSVLGSYFHDLQYRCPDNGNHSDNRTHNDCIQLHYPNGVTIRGNNFQAFIDTATSTYASPTFNGSGVQQTGYQYFSTGRTDALSGILIGAVGPVLGPVDILENWFNGSAFAYINGHPNWTTGGPVLVDGNRWGRGHAAVGDDWCYSMNASVNDTMTNNFYEDDGTPFNTRHNP